MSDHLAFLNTRYIALDAGGLNAAEDLDGRLIDFLEAQKWSAMIVRPDFYVYGGVGPQKDLAALVNDLLADLVRAGVKLPIAGDVLSREHRLSETDAA